MSKISLVEGGIHNTIPTKEITIKEALDLVSSDKYKALVEKIRECEDKAEKSKLKIKLDYFMFGGTFEKRNNKSLKKSSQLVVLDLDDTTDEVREKLMKDKFVYFIFTSPSGNGLKVGVKIPSVEDDTEYKQHWNGVSEYFDIEENDEKTKDISRACFVSYDNNIYYNPESEVLTKVGSKLMQTKETYVKGVGMVEGEVEDDFIKKVKEKWVSGDRQELAMSVAGYLRKNRRMGLNSALSIVEGIARDCQDEEVSQRLAAVRATYDKDEGEIKGISGLKDAGVVKSNDFAIFGIKGQVEQFYNSRPFCYNKSGMFLVWDNELKKYDIVDDTDMLNGMEDLGIDTISSKMKTEILNALKQYGRRNIPLDPPLSWVQFKDRVFDFKNGEEFEATPKYLFTTPMPFSPGESEETPTIDSLFKEWVGEDYKKTLEEIAAYSACSDQFMQRMIALVGGGSNGKGTYNKFLIRLLGDDNTCSSEIKELSSNQFETSVIWKKQLCIMGEMSQGDMKNSNQLKKLSGEDKIRYCFKGKTPFTDTSITTLLSNTNNLPKTPDKTMGFYRKWLIVDFPNQFTTIKHGLIENIPDEEMENFCRKILRILKELYKTQKFTNEGSFQDRMDRYEERSNPIPKFIENHFEESVGSSVELKYFCNLYNKYAKENHQSILSVRQIGKILRDDGYETTSRKRDMGDGTKSSSVVIMNLSLKTIETIETIVNLSESPCKESNEKHDGSNGSNGFDNKSLKTIETIEELSESPCKESNDKITICPKCSTPMMNNKCLGDCE